MAEWWRPASIAVGFVVIVLELLVGVRILGAIRFNAALLIGTFLNTHFIAAGVVNPSAFYIIIQMALLGSAAGRVLSLERRVASGRSTVRWYASGGFCWLVLAIWGASNAGTWGPDGVRDPGTVLAFLGAIGAVYGLVRVRDELRPQPDEMVPIGR